MALALVATHRIPLRAVPAELGLDRPIDGGLGWAPALTLPMLAGFLLLGRGVFFEDGGWACLRERPWAVLGSRAGAGLVEETLFRGDLFRQLVLRARWPASRGIPVPAAVFGLLHVPPSWGRPPGEIAGAVLITAVGGPLANALRLGIVALTIAVTLGRRRAPRGPPRAGAPAPGP